MSSTRPRMFVAAVGTEESRRLGLVIAAITYRSWLHLSQNVLPAATLMRPARIIRATRRVTMRRFRSAICPAVLFLPWLGAPAAILSAPPSHQADGRPSRLSAATMEAGGKGACCDEFFGDCTMTSEQDCIDSAGSFQGPDADCAAVACGGACCDGRLGLCTQTGPGRCADRDAVFHGLGSECAPISCPKGACCLRDGDCEDIGPIRCDELEGEFLGDQTECRLADCVGACCGLFGDCLPVDPEFCELTGGIFQGLGTPCEGIECGGACCFPYACRKLSEQYCPDIGGEFRGLGVLCDDVTCTGACCVFPEGCLNGETGRSCRETWRGDYQSDGSTCANEQTACRLESGACCVRYGCFDGNTFECALSRGIFQGEGTTCETSVCVSCPGLHSCCETHRTLGCEDPDCCEAVCTVDPICCFGFNGWDEICVAQADRLCGGCDGSVCPLRAILGGRHEGLLTLLLAFRDDTLGSTQTGQAYIDLYYRHAREIHEILDGDRELRRRCVAALVRYGPSLEAFLAGRDPELGRREVRLITNLIDELALQGSPALRENLEHLTAALLGGELANLFDIRIDPTSDRRRKTNSRPGR